MPTYDFLCEPCDKGFEEYVISWKSPNPPCTKCYGPTDRVFTLGVEHKASSVFPYITSHIDKSGKAIEVKSASHLEALCKANGVTHRPDMGWTTKEYKGYDPRTGKQKYSESSGVGLPGCWV